MEDDVLECYMKAGRVASSALEKAVGMTSDGGSVLDLANAVETFIKDQGAGLAFPINISIDSQAAHFTPRSSDTLMKFRAGQVVKLDVGAHVNGYVADTARTVEVGTSLHRDLIKASEEALGVAIELIGVAPLGKVGGAIEDTIVNHGYRPVSNLTGHSLERFDLHSGLSVPNVARPDQKIVEEGVALAVEPFATTGTGKVEGKVPGNIYLYRREVKAKNDECKRILDLVSGLPTFPFSERACATVVEDTHKPMATLVRQRAFHSYAILMDEPGSFVSQSEHTVIILGGETIVTTK